MVWEKSKISPLAFKKDERDTNDNNNDIIYERHSIHHIAYGMQLTK